MSITSFDILNFKIEIIILQNNLQQESIGSRIEGVDEFSKQTTNASKRKDILNVAGKKNTLNISILFNRDIQLAKSVRLVLMSAIKNYY